MKTILNYQKSHFYRNVLMAWAAGTVIMSGCGKQEAETVSTDTSATVPLLKAFAEQVVLKSYSDLAAKADEVKAAVMAYSKVPGVERLEAARVAWRAARTPWENSEAFLFGPVDTEGHDPNLDSWPVDEADLEKVIAAATGPEVITPEVVAALSEGLKGFHAVEFLLFTGADGDRADAAASHAALQAEPRRLNFLLASVEAFKQQCDALLADYAGEDGFAARIASPGKGNLSYPDPAAAYEEMVMGLVGIADESANVKLLEPATAGDARLLESRFSGNTLADVRDNIEGIRISYTTAIAPRLSSSHPDLHVRIVSHIDQYAHAVSQIPAPYVDQLAAAKEEAIQAADAGNTLMQILEGELLPVVQSW